MTQFQALFVKYLRVRQEGTWRWVHKEYMNRYPEQFYGKYEMGNQLIGMELCNEAMDLLGESSENVENGWN